MNVPDLPAFFAHCIERDEQNGNPWDPTQVHSSDLGVAIGEGCPRALWLRVRGAPRKPDSAGKRLMFRKAQEIHVLLAGWMEKYLPGYAPGWRVVAVEELVENEGTGRLDVLIEHQFLRGTFEPSGAMRLDKPLRLVVDFKSMRGAGFKYLDGPKPSHVIQVQDYIRAKDAAGGIILYTDREGQNGQRQFFIERDDARVTTAWATAKGYAESPEPAPKIAPKKSSKSNIGELPWQCTYCNCLSVSCNGALTGDGDPFDWRPDNSGPEAKL